MNKKPLGIKSYGSIPHISTSRLGTGDHTCELGQELIATKKVRDKYDKVICQVKLDGTNVAACNIDGAIIPLVRSGYTADSSPYRQHHMFAHWVYTQQERFAELLRPGERVCGEWLALAHGTKYDLRGTEPFIAFDIMVGKKRAPYLEFKERVSKLDFVTPYVLSMGAAYPLEKVLKDLETPRHGELDPVEGAVWRVETEGKVNFLVKWVRSDKVDGKYLPEISGQEYWNWLPDWYK